MRAVLLSAILTVAAASPVPAECTGRQAVPFIPGESESGTVYITGQRGDTCRGKLTGAALSTFERVDVRKRPTNGRLTIEGAALIYQPHPTFVGKDAFAHSICTRGRSGGGCSTVNYFVTIQ